MRILYLAHRIPYPPNKGDKIRSFHELRIFSRNHEIHLLAFFDDPQDRSHIGELRKFCADVELVPLSRPIQTMKAGAAMLRRRPWTLGYFSSRRMREAIAAKIRTNNFDVVFAYSSSMAGYLATTSLGRVLDFVDSDASKWAQYVRHTSIPWSWIYGFEASALTRFEQQMIGSFDQSIFVSKREIASYAENVPHEKLCFIKNGIDIEFFQPSKSREEGSVVIFTGAMDYFPNADAVVQFAHRVFPIVRIRCPSARFLIVGSNPTSAVRRLARLPGIEVTGSVPDIRVYLSKAHVAVAPLRIAQGIQNKLLEAIAMGLPVVATASATGGIADCASLPISIVEGNHDFAEKVIFHLENPRLPQDEVQQYREHLQKNYDWNENLNRFEEIFRSVSANRAMVSDQVAS
jgi:sugar transferase (PEP-CTERM/EpsH1 system associated)